jgi:hypothetical protein
MYKNYFIRCMGILMYDSEFADMPGLTLLCCRSRGVVDEFAANMRKYHDNVTVNILEDYKKADVHETLSFMQEQVSVPSVFIFVNARLFTESVFDAFLKTAEEPCGLHKIVFVIRDNTTTRIPRTIESRSVMCVLPEPTLYERRDYIGQVVDNVDGSVVIACRGFDDCDLFIEHKNVVLSYAQRLGALGTAGAVEVIKVGEDILGIEGDKSRDVIALIFTVALWTMELEDRVRVVHIINDAVRSLSNVSANVKMIVRTAVLELRDVMKNG